MTAQVKAYLWIALAVLVSGGYVAWRKVERDKGAAQAREGALLVENTTLKGIVVADSIALAHHDTAIVFRNVTRSDTVLQRIIDSAIVQRRDTVTVTRTILVEAKAALDSTKRVADACCQLARDYQRRYTVTDSLYRLAVGAQPNFLERRASLTIGYGATVSGGRVSAGPTIVAGFRLWP